MLGDLQAGTFGNWLAAAPVVAIGAPFGALVVSRIGRRPTLVLVSLLCVGQFAWTLTHEKEALTIWSVFAALLGVVLFLLIFQDMYRHGYSLARRSRQRE
jgi:predicted MFS family arabinose efflux permease